MISQIGKKYPDLINPEYMQLRASADASTLRDLKDALIGAFYAGTSVGQNQFTGDQVDGAVNIIPTDYKTRAFVEAHGCFPERTFATLG